LAHDIIIIITITITLQACEGRGMLRLSSLVNNKLFNTWPTKIQRLLASHSWLTIKRQALV